MKRRDFIKFLGLTSFSFFAKSCGLKDTSEKLIPFLIPPEEGFIPGEPVYKKTVCMECPYMCPVEAKLYDKVYKGKRKFYPVKFEGLSSFPFTGGSLCIRGQASLQRTFSEKRLKDVILKEKGGFKKSDWSSVYNILTENLKNGKNYLLTGKLQSSLKNLTESFCKEYNFKRIYFEFFNFSNIRKANEICFGIRDIPFYHFDKADFLLTFGTSFLEGFLNPLTFSKFFSERKFEWYHFEPHFSLTGMNSDKRIILKPESEIFIMIYLLRKLIERKGEFKEILEYLPSYELDFVAENSGVDKNLLKEIEEKSLNLRSLIVAGDISSMTENGFYLNILVNIFNYLKGNYPEVIDFYHSYGFEDIDFSEDIEREIDKASGEENNILFVNNINIFKFLRKEKLEKFLKSFKIKVLFSDTYIDNIDKFDIILPLSTSPEFSGFSETFKNFFVIQEKLMEKIYDTKSFGDVIFDLLKIDNKIEALNFESYIEKELNNILGERKREIFEKGYVVLDKVLSFEFKKDNVLKEIKNFNIKEISFKNTLIVVPSLRFYDGRSSSIMLLNEIPDPLSTISYRKFLYVSEDFANKRSLKNGDEVSLSYEGKELKLPIFITKFLKESIFVLDINFYDGSFSVKENTKDFIVYFNLESIEKTGRRENLPILSGSFLDYGRILKHDVKEHDDIKKKSEYLKSIYGEHEHLKYRWAMVIDLDKCTGCSACVAACFVENNIPCTGYEEHLKGREMSWIRIEPYINNDKFEFVPMLCQHCDYAPCEPVCPVSATYHNPEGLNVQVYNRCVGTRYCSNNCPYKVRRFNWFDWSDKKSAPYLYFTEELKLMTNPEVSIRPKGVMEKCSFCIQRIRKAKDRAKDEGRDVKDGEVIPACMQTCPTKAIIFGNLKDQNSEVYKKSKEKSFRILEELGVEPSVYYIKNNERKI